MIIVNHMMLCMLCVLCILVGGGSDFKYGDNVLSGFHLRGGGMQGNFPPR